MFEPRKAAQYWIVAWKKDWTLRMYWAVVCEDERLSWMQAQLTYPWLPEEGWFILDGRVRRWMAMAYPMTNNALWDAPDTKSLLQLADKVLGLQPSVAKPRKVERTEASQRRRSKLRAKVTEQLVNQTDANAAKHLHHWDMCKKVRSKG